MSEAHHSEGKEDSKEGRPVVGKDAVTTLALKLFGLTVTSIKELNSYDDRNYHIKVERESKNPYIEEVSPHGYILKVTNTKDSTNPGILAAQVEMMLFLHSRGVAVPKVERNVTGSHMVYGEINGDKVGEVGGENIVRLLTFLPGKILHQVPYTAALMYQSGSFIAKIDNELKDFNNEALRQRKFVWSMDSVAELPDFLCAVKDEKRRELIQEVLQSWQDNVVPLLPILEKGFIHGDFNEQNVIVSATEKDPSTYHVDGVIDFGDINHTCLLFELAICIMYLMIEMKAMHPNEVAGHVIAGYLTHRTLSEEEWTILKECVAARFAQSLVLGAYSFLKDPDNQYLLMTAAQGWRVLDTFWQTPKEQLIAQWRTTLKDYQEGSQNVDST